MALTSKQNDASKQLVHGIPDELSDYARIDDDRMLWVVKEQTNNPRLKSLIARFQKLGKIRGVSFSTIQEIQECAKRSVETDIDSATIKAAVSLFSSAASKRASDIHLRIHELHADVYFRVLGNMKHESQLPVAFASSVMATIYSVLADIAESVYNPKNFQDARIASREFLPLGVHGIRVASGPTVDGTHMVLRLLYESSGTDSDTSGYDRLLNLGYDAAHIDQLSMLMKKPAGINIVAGPTGSGKSTTLKHILETISSERPELNIITVEDPPEYQIAGAVQMPVTNATTEDERRRAFSAAIRAALRMDPDVIMIGEIRDRESARLALQAAMTGHQVWATLHTNSAFGIVIRLVELLASPEMPNPIEILGDSTVLSGMIFQRLVQTNCPSCKVPLTEDVSRIPTDVLGRVKVALNGELSTVHTAGNGCPACKGAGVTGRSVCAEVVRTNEQMLQILRRDGVDPAKEHWIAKMDGKTINQHVIDKIRAGVVDPHRAEGIVGLI